MIFPAPSLTKDSDRRSRSNFTRAVARKFARFCHSCGRRGSKRACAGGHRERRMPRGERGAELAAEGPMGERARGPASARRRGERACCRRGNNDVQQSGPLSGRGRAGPGWPGGPGPGGAELGRRKGRRAGTGLGLVGPGRDGIGPTWPGPAWAARPARAVLRTQSACDGVECFKFCYLSADSAQSAHSADSVVNSVVQFAEQRYGDHA
jgi:hypothetical protein